MLILSVRYLQTLRLFVFVFVLVVFLVFEFESMEVLLVVFVVMLELVLFFALYLLLLLLESNERQKAHYSLMKLAKLVFASLLDFQMEKIQAIDLLLVEVL